MTAETKARAVAIAHAETAGTQDPRRDALQHQLSIYRDRLDGIELPTPSRPQQPHYPTPERSVGIEL